MKIGIVIVNWNGGKDTCECLMSLSQIEIPKDTSVHVCVVDNNSTDNSKDMIGEFITELKDQMTITYSWLGLSENKGFSGGNNEGIQNALLNKSDYILLLNNDVVVHKSFLKRLLESASPNAIVGPKIYFAPGYEFHKSRYNKSEKGKVIWYAGGLIDWNNVYCSHRGVDEVDHGQYNNKNSTDFISGCCMLFHKSLTDAIGLLDDKYFLYYEDVDFCMRAKAQGVKLLYEPASYLWHKNAQSSGSSGSSVHVYYQTRNRLVFGMKYAPFRAKLALFRESLQFIAGGGLKQRAVIDFFKGHYGKK